MDINLYALSTRSFEQLAQTLALDILSPAVTPFGDGRDGGREATWRGPVNYPSPIQPWSGYGVIQAKFRQVPASSSDEGKWALAELNKELKSYEAPGSSRSLPEYYLFITNATLTPTPQTGGYDRLHGRMQEFATKHSLKGFDIWDYGKLRAYLEARPHIRKSYAAWITASDIIELLLDRLDAEDAAIADLTSLVIAKEFLGAEEAHLEQAGDSGERGISLADVFIDLPVGYAEGPFEPEDDFFAIEHILETANLKLNPRALKQANIDPREARITLVGGPGQGKSTVTQFACQLFRAQILSTLEPHRRSTEADHALQKFNTQLASLGLALPSVRRLPIHIVLNELAHYLNEAPAGTGSIYTFLAARYSRLHGDAVDSKAIRHMLSATPILLVLDGLDEVPESTNRTEVLDAVQTLLIRAQQDDVDALVLTTTRPQGYNDDFSPVHYRHYYLALLDADLALRYGDALADTRFVSGTARSEKVKQRLRKAVQQPAISKLMQTPLQVTIMSLLVDRTGQPPQEQWSLFSAYYDTIYRRELERDIPAAAVLSDFKPQIDRIHHEAGLALQIASELSGGTLARLTPTDLDELVTRRLAADGYQGPQLDRLRNDILEAAKNRLVFLTGVREGAIGFELRSLQEFMAAEAMFDIVDSNEPVRDRLARIASATNWENAFLFAAGRSFKQNLEYRDTLIRICEQLDDARLSGPLSSHIQAGSLLALALLEDSSCRKAPLYVHLLWSRARPLLLSDNVLHHRRLALVAVDYGSPIADDLLREVKSSLAQGSNSADQLMARWTTVFQLARGYEPAADYVSDQFFEGCTPDATLASVALDAALIAGHTDFLNHFASSLLDAAGDIPTHIARFSAAWQIALPHAVSLGPIRSISTERHLRRLGAGEYFPRTHLGLFEVELHLTRSGHAAYSLTMLSLRNDRYEEYVQQPDRGHQFFSQLGNFGLDPSIASLAAVVRAAPLIIDAVETADIPWLVSSLLMREGPREQIAQDVEAGVFGSPADWIAKESAWIEHGLPTSEFGRPFLMPTERGPIEMAYIDHSILDGYRSSAQLHSAELLEDALLLVENFDPAVHERLATMFLVGHALDREDVRPLTEAEALAVANLMLVNGPTRDWSYYSAQTVTHVFLALSDADFPEIMSEVGRRQLAFEDVLADELVLRLIELITSRATWSVEALDQYSFMLLELPLSPRRDSDTHALDRASIAIMLRQFFEDNSSKSATCLAAAVRFGFVSVSAPDSVRMMVDHPTLFPPLLRGLSHGQIVDLASVLHPDSVGVDNRASYLNRLSIAYSSATSGLQSVATRIELGLQPELPGLDDAVAKQTQR